MLFYNDSNHQNSQFWYLRVSFDKTNFNKVFFFIFKLSKSVDLTSESFWVSGWFYFFAFFLNYFKEYTSLFRFLGFFWIRKWLKIDLLGVEHPWPDFLVTFSHQNLGRASDVSLFCFKKKIRCGLVICPTKKGKVC